MKKIFKSMAAVLAVLIAVSAIAVGVNAGTGTLKKAGRCGEDIYWSYVAESGLVTICGNGEMYDYNESDNQSPFAGNLDIKYVDIDDGVTKVGNYSFKDCYSIEQVNFGKDVKSVGDYAFNNCSIEEISFPSGLKDLGKEAFGCCDKLTEVEVPDGVTVIPAGLFDNCENLAAIKISDKVTKIGELAFYGTAFYNDKSNWEDTVLYMGNNLIAVNSDIIGNVVIKPGTVVIADGAFMRCHTLEGVTIPKSVTTIGDKAFYECDLIADASLFDTVTYIGAEAFRYCYNIKSFIIPKKVKEIKDGTFYGCDALETIEVPESIEAIGDNAFKGCLGLKDIYYPGTKTHWDSIPRGTSNDALDDATIHIMRILDVPVINMTNVASTGKIKVTWNAVEDATSYEVYRTDTLGGDYTLMKVTSNLSYINTSAKAGETFLYKVRALSDDGRISDYCFPKSNTCKIARPVITLSSNADTGKPVITWEKVNNAVSYKIYRSDAKDGVYRLIMTTSELSYTNSTAEAGKKYYYKVKALGSTAEQDSAYSSAKYRTCDLAKPVIKASFSENNNPKISWNAVQNATGYKVYRCTSADGTYKLIKTTTATKFVNTSITTGTYFYKVRAICEDAAANSVLSEAACVSLPEYIDSETENAE